MNNEWYNVFMKMLYKKYPKKNQLAEALMDLLCIEREAVYRRLRQDVPFPANELVKIASAWNISLDEITGIMSSKVSFQMHLANYLTPSEEDMKFFRKRVRALERLKNESNSEYILVCNHLARSFSTGFTNLYRFYVFKWAYEYCNSCNEKSSPTLADTVIPEKLLKEMNVYHKLMRYVTNTTYILDSMIFDSYIRDIQFFHSIFLITDEDKEILKKELYALLDYMLEIANNGCFPETKNKIHLYVSMLHINTNYSYFYNGKTEIARIHAFNMYDNITYNPAMMEDFKIWLQKKKRTSILISEADERSRIKFFMEQRQLIDSL